MDDFEILLCKAQQLVHPSVLLQMQQEINFVLQHCKQCWIIIMDEIYFLLCEAQQLVRTAARTDVGIRT
jgi:hypothetical protein